MSRNEGKSNRVPLIVGIAAVLAIVLVYTTPLREYVNPSLLSKKLETIGDVWWAPLLFIALYLLFNVLLLPATLLTLAAGAVWGWFGGGLWVLLASTIGSAVPYFIARQTGSGWVESLVERRAGALYGKLRQEGFITLLLMRLVPLVPYNVLNYAAGFAGIRPPHYLSATLIGTIPGIFIFTYLSDAIASGVVTPRDAFVRILIAGVLLAGLALASRLLASRLRRRIGH